MQFSEASTKLELFSFNLQGAMGAGSGLFDVLWNNVVIYAKKPANSVWQMTNSITGLIQPLVTSTSELRSTK